MPKGTRVEKVFQALKKTGMPVGEAAATAQKQTGQSLATGRKLKPKKR